jgi:hypothetical protein
MAQGFLLISAAVVIFGLDCWNWGTSGSFEPSTLSTVWRAIGFSEPEFESQSIQSVAFGILHFPITIALAVMGVGLIKWSRRA